MKGQWIGRTAGGQIGSILFNADELEDKFEGAIYTVPDDNKLPATLSVFKTKDKNPNFKFVADTMPINPDTSSPCPWEEIQSRFPGVLHSKIAKVSGQFTDTELTIEAQTDIGIHVECKLIRPPRTDQSEVASEIMSWDEYKKHLESLSKDEYLFRGQERPWKLRTSFHRHERYILRRFIYEDIPQLHIRLSTKTKHFYDLQKPLENGAFFCLAQHHGYPTPLLDWTRSPYVAAYFAFRKVGIEHSNDNLVRIFLFDQNKWKSHFNQLYLLDVAKPHFSISEFYAIDNERVVPQQAVSTVTNIDDIEEYVMNKEEMNNCKYLYAIDIDASERRRVIEELSFMGINAGSMFPGLDGACEELKERMFRKL